MANTNHLSGTPNLIEGTEAFSRPSSWHAIWPRLTKMSRRELWTRARQGLFKRWDSSAFRGPSRFPRVFSTVRVEGNEPSRFFFDTEEIPDIVKLIKTLLPDIARNLTDRADRICQHRFDLLGYKNLDYGLVIDWHLDAVSGKRAPRKKSFKIHYLDFAEVGDHKVIWELNRHQHLVTLAKAYCITGGKQYILELGNQWYQWHSENPYPVGINWVSSLEVGFRTLSWLWIRQLLGDCSILPADFQSDLLGALAQNGKHISRYLSSYFSPNTHLLGEAVALFFLGTMCPQIPSAADWQKAGWEIILTEVQRQVQADGMYFEQSVYYHVYALDLLLHARVLAERNGRPIPSSLDQRIEMMAEVLSVLGQTGAPARIGDDDGGRAFDPARNCAEQLLDPLSTAAVLFHRSDFTAFSKSLREETLWLLGTQGADKFAKLPAADPIAISRGFESSGIYVMASEGSLTQLVARAGPMGALRAGHSHCDLLSIHLSTDGRELLADPGTYRYTAEGGEREQFRGTSAHNTLRIDGSDQAEANDVFSWNRPPTVRVEHWIQGRTFDLLAASHFGYRRLISPATHQRWIFHLKSYFWFVRDVIEGDGRNLLEVFWHLAPGLGWQATSSNSAFGAGASDSTRGLTLFTAEGHSWFSSIHRGWNSPAYGRKTGSSVLSFRTETELPVDFPTILYPGEMVPARLTLLQSTGGRDYCGNVVGYRFEERGMNHLFFFGKSGKPWTFRGWTSDATFLYCRLASNAEPIHIILCEGSFAEIRGHRVLDARRRVNRCEWIGPAKSPRVWCSDEEAISCLEQTGQLVSEAAIGAEIQENSWEGTN